LRSDDNSFNDFPENQLTKFLKQLKNRLPSGNKGARAGCAPFLDPRLESRDC